MESVALVLVVPDVAVAAGEQRHGSRAPALPLSSDEEDIVALCKERHEDTSEGELKHVVLTVNSRARVKGVHLQVLQTRRVPKPQLPVGHLAELIVSQGVTLISRTNTSSGNPVSVTKPDDPGAFYTRMTFSYPDSILACSRVEQSQLLVSTSLVFSSMSSLGGPWS